MLHLCVNALTTKRNDLLLIGNRLHNELYLSFAVQKVAGQFNNWHISVLETTFNTIPNSESREKPKKFDQIALLINYISDHHNHEHLGRILPVRHT